MNIGIAPSRLSGEVLAVSSKSHAHRLMIAAALADSPTQINFRFPGDDIAATAECIRAMGGGADYNEDGVKITPMPAVFTTTNQSPALDFNESGSSARFLIPIAAALFDSCSFSGRGRLPMRPFFELCTAMEQNGCRFTSHSLPARVSGRLAPGIYSLPANISSQYISGLLLALPLLSDRSEIRLSGPFESASYVEMTLEVLALFGIKILKTPQGFQIPGGQKYISPGIAKAEGDWSNSAFWLCAGALSGQITVFGLNPSSVQGDREIVGILNRFGADVRSFSDRVIVSPRTLWSLEGIEIDAAQIPDLVPVLANLAATANGTTRIFNAGRLRLKESDRLDATVKNIRALGGNAHSGEDFLIIEGMGRPLPGGKAESFGDHRMAMSAAVLSCACSGPVIITGAQAVSKSYPAFFDDFSALGGRVERL